MPATYYTMCESISQFPSAISEIWLRTHGRGPKIGKKNGNDLGDLDLDLFGRPRDLCPDISFLKMHIHERFRDDRTSGKWSKNPDGQTDRRPDGHSLF